MQKYLFLYFQHVLSFCFKVDYIMIGSDPMRHLAT